MAEMRRPAVDLLGTHCGLPGFSIESKVALVDILHCVAEISTTAPLILQEAAVDEKTGSEQGRSQLSSGAPAPQPMRWKTGICCGLFSAVLIKRRDVKAAW